MEEWNGTKIPNSRMRLKMSDSQISQGKRI